MNEQNMPQEQNSTNIWVIVVAVVITALVVGGVVYALQSSRLRSAEQSFQQQITLLQNQIDQLQQVKQNQNQNNQPVVDQNENVNQQVNQPEEIVYSNSEYEFSFQLPQNWKSYSIVTNEWEGYTPEPYAIVERGSLISIRHPQWTSQNPRQDIPIMVFTIKQWNNLQAGEFHIGAAPINPSELGRNAKYVFALPARYNYAFLTGWEEVGHILNNSPLSVSKPSE
ncbi:MAG: hypothetical protein M0P94_03645 [Candidatus Absconditabacterales bacterium]|nr:hypothetical protein [Candidatus Absconditabacterales bacterium]